MNPLLLPGEGPPDPVGDAAAERVVHLRAAGTSVVLALGGTGLPSILHWGADLGDLDGEQRQALAVQVTPPVGDSVVYSPPQVGVLPSHAGGWLGRPGVTGSRDGRDWSLAVQDVGHRVDHAGDAGWPDGPAGATRVVSTGRDVEAQVEVSTELELHRSGVLRLRAAARNVGDEPYRVDHLEPALPVPAEAAELLDMAGRHTHERHPQRRPFDIGSWVREARGGRPGHDSPTVLCAGEPGFGFRAGRVWGVHLAWSGNQVLHAERTATGHRLLRGGELLLPGEVHLAPGQEYLSPWLVGSWGEGLDDLSGRLHRFVRNRPQHPRTPRPVLLNTWEAVYFDHDLPTLLRLADLAAEVGVERYVLDDGWFRGRRDDRRGLGDWEVDPDVYPQGLHPLVARVRELGMEFGLWVEPEMVNLDSDLARAHPDWVLGTARGPGVPSRYQHVLDLAHPQAFAHLLARLSALVSEYGIDYLKWDHNRPLVDAGHGPARTPGVHAQTRALYRLLAALKDRHPGLEIESCAGGGGRTDLGVLEHTDRVWASDCIDALERQRIQRWTALLLPPELVGTHIGAPRAHTTGRVHTLDLRAATALWGHLGVEWDLTRADPGERRALARWIAVHKELRELLHEGRVVHADPANPALELEGVVAADNSQALYRLTAVDHTLTWPPGRVRLPGLAAGSSYRVQLQPPAERAAAAGTGLPAWAVRGVVQSGRVLGEVGLQAPTLDPETAVLIRAVREP